jgi:uncharacterized protein (DUF1810 family)
MRSFRLHVGEGKHLTAAGCACLLVACAATAGVGFLFAGELVDNIGINRVMVAAVVACGGATGAVAAVAFHAAGVQLVSKSAPKNDPHDLNRFVRAQADDYARALAEVRAGRKRSHWMWYVFPQFRGLGFSSTSQLFAIKSRAEAVAYLAHPVLGPRLVECCEAALAVTGRSANEIFGSPDDLKLKSCVTLFAAVSPPGSVFERVLEVYFGGERDAKTLELLDDAKG